MTTRLNSGTARSRSARRRHRARAVVAAGLALLVAGLGVAAALEPADASALQVTATSDAAVSRGACTNQPLAVSSTTYSGTSTTQIAVTTLDGGPLDAACVGRPLSVIVQAGDDTASRLVSVTMSSATDRPVFAVDFVTAQATRALVTIDGFALPTTWAAPTQPPAPVLGCTVRNADGSQASAGFACTVNVLTWSWEWPPFSGAFGFTVTYNGQGASLPEGGDVQFTVGLPAAPTGTWDNLTIVPVDNRLTIVSLDPVHQVVTGRHAIGYNGDLGFTIVVG